MRKISVIQQHTIYDLCIIIGLDLVLLKGLVEDNQIMVNKRSHDTVYWSLSKIE
jgi:hypothetical protein